MELMWTQEAMDRARKIVMERFAMNSVTGHLSPQAIIGADETTTKSNRFNYKTGLVDDLETLMLYEPYSEVKFTEAQVSEFAKAQGADVGMTKAATSLTRAASALARWHDVLFFRGLEDGVNDKFRLQPPFIQVGRRPAPAAPSLREAALSAEGETKVAEISIKAPLNIHLVDAVSGAVQRLEERGYFALYHLVLGEKLWRALHEPSNSLVLPRERIEPTLMGGTFHKTTTLDKSLDKAEALLVSLDGPTFDCVLAGNPAQYPWFEFLRAERTGGEETYLYRVRERFVPRIRENRAIVRLREE